MGRRLADLVAWENRLRRLFHVKHSFAEAKPAEQGVQHILHARPTGKPVERPSRHPKVFGRQNNVSIVCNRPCERIASFRNVGGLTAIESHLALRRQQGSGKPAHHV
jgi:hypothetical protein